MSLMSHVTSPTEKAAAMAARPSTPASVCGTERQL